MYYDPERVTFTKLIDTFWTTHDPSDEKNQNEKYGEKSVIFAANEVQLHQARECLLSKKEDLNQNSIFTEIREHISYSKAPQKDQQYYFQR